MNSAPNEVKRTGNRAAQLCDRALRKLSLSPSPRRKTPAKSRLSIGAPVDFRHSGCELPSELTNALAGLAHSPGGDPGISAASIVPAGAQSHARRLQGDLCVRLEGAAAFAPMFAVLDPATHAIALQPAEAGEATEVAIDSTTELCTRIAMGPPAVYEFAIEGCAVFQCTTSAELSVWSDAVVGCMKAVAMPARPAHPPPPPPVAAAAASPAAKGAPVAPERTNKRASLLLQSQSDSAATPPSSPQSSLVLRSESYPQSSPAGGELTTEEAKMEAEADEFEKLVEKGDFMAALGFDAPPAAGAGGKARRCDL